MNSTLKGGMKRGKVGVGEMIKNLRVLHIQQSMSFLNLKGAGKKYTASIQIFF